MQEGSTKKPALRLTVAVGILLLVCTVASRSVYTLLLPEVTALEFTSGSLTYTGSYSAVAVAATGDTATVTAGDNWTVTAVLVEDGQTVEAGDALFAIDISSYKLQLQQLETSIQQQKNSINGTAWTGGDALVQQMQLEALELQYANLKSKFPSDGKVRATAGGRVGELAGLGTVAAGRTLATITAGDGPAVLQWSVSQTDAENILREGTELSCSFSVVTDTLAEGGAIRLERQTARAAVTAAAYDLTTGRYDLTAAVTDAAGDPLRIAAGTPVQLTAVTTTPEYGALVPLACLFRDTDGSYYVYELSEDTDAWGLRTQVIRRSVTVLESNHLYAAVQCYFPTQGMHLAAYPSRTLADGDTVRVVSGG